MNYYQHHIGDFNNATRHLTRTERSIYRDMIEMYYDTEAPLPADVPLICRKVMARSDEERAAVQTLLDEFFYSTPEGFRHDRCDKELEKAVDAMNDADERRKNEKERQKRNRERRADLFAKLREFDEVPPWNTSTETLLSRVEYHLSRVTGPDVTGSSQACHAPATANQYPVTTTHLTNDQYPVPITDLEEKTIAPAVAAAPKKAAKKDEPNPLNLETWLAYKHAYALRYGVPPIQNAKSNSLVKQIVIALGAEAPAVAGFFVQHNGRNYVAAMHQLGLLQIDHAKLRTEWATNQQMTSTKAQQADKTATNLDAFAPLIAAAKARE